MRRTPLPWHSTQALSTQIIDLTDDVDAATNRSTYGTENKTDTVKSVDILSYPLDQRSVEPVETMSNIVESNDTADRSSSPLDQDYIDRFLSEILNDNGSNY